MASPELADGTVPERVRSESALRVALVALCVHLAGAGVHGLTHGLLPVPLPAWEYALAGVALIALPLAGTALFAAGRVRLGAWTLLVAGAAAVAFEGGAHFLVSNPDHVTSVQSGRVVFETTALVSTAANGALVVAGGWLLSQSQNRP